MAIFLKGIRLENVVVAIESGDPSVSAHYSLISNADKVLAKQEVGGYGGMKVEMSRSTKSALETFLGLYKADVHILLGFEVDSSLSP